MLLNVFITDNVHFLFNINLFKSKNIKNQERPLKSEDISVKERIFPFI